MRSDNTISFSTTRLIFLQNESYCGNLPQRKNLSWAEFSLPFLSVLSNLRKLLASQQCAPFFSIFHSLWCSPRPCQVFRNLMLPPGPGSSLYGRCGSSHTDFHFQTNYLKNYKTVFYFIIKVISFDLQATFNLTSLTFGLVKMPMARCLKSR